MQALLVLALGWLLGVIVVLGLLSLRLLSEHRERMARIARGIMPPERRRTLLPTPLLLRRTGALQGGVRTALVGLALTLGLYPIGFIVPLALGGPSPLGPWLLTGVIPLVVGSALILGHYLTPGRPVERPPEARTDHPGRRPRLSQERPASAQSASARGEPRTLPDRGGNGATEPEWTTGARYMQKERHAGVVFAVRPNAPVTVSLGIATHCSGSAACPLVKAGSRCDCMPL